ncbi:acyl-CoA synthetase [Hydrogenophilus islandicus]
MKLDRKAPDWQTLWFNFRWQIPRRFNIGYACCTRWSSDRSRLALFFEDEQGKRQSWSFWEIQKAANRLSNALQALGVARGDRVAIVMAQRPETAIAHIACYQMGAIALPLSHLFGPDALEYRLNHAEAKVAIVDETTLPKVEAIGELPHLQNLLFVGDGKRVACTGRIREWHATLDKASDHFNPVRTTVDDPAVIIYTSGTTGNPKGALMAHRTLLGNIPGFVCSHDFYPKRGDLFWSPADWAWTGGLFDVLLPTWYFGQPLLAYQGRFDPERAFWLLERYEVRNTFLFPTALKMMMKYAPQPTQRYRLALRTIMSGGEAVGETLQEWAQSQLGVTINEIFGQTEINYLLGGCSSRWPAKPGAVGLPYPGHDVAVLDEEGHELPPGEEGEICVRRSCHGSLDPIFFLEYWRNPEATRNKFFGDPGSANAWGRTGDLAVRDHDGYFWYRGRLDDVFKCSGYRIGPNEIENCLMKHPAVANAAVIGVPDETKGNFVKAFVVLQPGWQESAELAETLREHVRRHLAPYETPREIEFLDALPMTTTGKIQRRILREREAQRRSSS